MRLAIRLAALLTAGVLAVGCADGAVTSGSPASVPGPSGPASAAVASTSASAPGSGVASSSAGSPTPTPRNWASDPLAEAAGADFGAAAEQVNAAVAAAYQTYPIFNVHDLGAARAFFRLAATAEGKFVDAVTAIDFPAGMAADVGKLLDAEAALIALERRTIDAKTLEALDAGLRDYLDASRTAADASTVVRRDLGLPGVAP